MIFKDFDNRAGCTGFSPLKKHKRHKSIGSRRTKQFRSLMIFIGSSRTNCLGHPRKRPRFAKTAAKRRVTRRVGWRVYGCLPGLFFYYLRRGWHFHAVVMLIPVFFCALSIVLHLILLVFSFSASCSCSSSPSSSSPCSCSCCCRCSLHPIWIFLIDSLSIDYIHFRTYTSSCPGVFSTDKTMMQSWMLLKHRDIHCFLDLQAHHFLGYHLFWRPYLVQPVQSPPKATEEKRDGKHHRAGGVKGCSPRCKITGPINHDISLTARWCTNSWQHTHTHRLPCLFPPQKKPTHQKLQLAKSLGVFLESKKSMSCAKFGVARLKGCYTPEISYIDAQHIVAIFEKDIHFPIYHFKGNPISVFGDVYVFGSNFDDKLQGQLGA